MRYRPMGHSDLVVSVVGVGCNNFGRRIGPPETRAVIEAALDQGVTLFDTADSYGESEALLGEVLAGRRDTVVLATKFGNDTRGRVGAPGEPRGSRRYIRAAVESSLRRLRTDFIDLYQYHMPDGVTPMEETLAALDELVEEGLVRHIGSSNLAAWQVADADWLARTRGSARFIAAQNHYNLLHRAAEAELVPACLQYGIGLLPYFPLANGLLTGKYRRGAQPPVGTRLSSRPALIEEAPFTLLEALAAYAAERGRRLLDVAIGGLAARPAVACVIAGAMTPEQVRDNVAAGSWEPDPDDWADLDALLSTAGER